MFYIVFCFRLKPLTDVNTFCNFEEIRFKRLTYTVFLKRLLCQNLHVFYQLDLNYMKI